MDQQVLLAVSRLSRQLRAVKWLLGFFFVMLVAMLAILGFVAYKVITFTNHVTSQINNLETKASQIESKTSQSLDLKQQLCTDKSITTFLGTNNNLCK